MPARPRLAVAPGSFEELLRAPEEVLFRGRRDIERAWVRTYHETGRLICEHLLLHQERAGYGARVYQRAAARTRVSTRIL
ncbi:MAG: hypothetical protein EXS38_03605 [Opitutus sp.]|nr:hypothetical protein [Opitutus sp.]